MYQDIPQKQHSGVLQAYWAMLGELASQAENNDDAVLKHQVSGWYRLWNTITGDNVQPRWEIKRPELPVVLELPGIVEDSPVLRRIQSVIADHIGVSVEEVTLNSDRISLGLDSLDEIELVMAIEDEFDLEITDEEAEAFTTIRAVLLYVENRLNAKALEIQGI